MNLHIAIRVLYWQCRHHVCSEKLLEVALLRQSAVRLCKETQQIQYRSLQQQRTNRVCYDGLLRNQAMGAKNLIVNECECLEQLYIGGSSAEYIHFQTEPVVIYLCAEFYMPTSNGSLFIIIKWKFKWSIHVADMLLFYILLLKENSNKICIFFKDLLLYKISGPCLMWYYELFLLYGRHFGIIVDRI
jgi:hypothetical protein